MKKLKLFFAVLGAMLWASQSVQSQPYRPLTSYSVLFTTAGVGSSVQVGAQSRIARVVCSVTCFVAFPLTTTAGALSYPMMMPANVVQYIKITPGSYAYVIRESVSGGFLYVTEVE
jgi:hypothetical protein